MTVKTAGQFALFALGVTALAGCMTTNPAPVAAPVTPQPSVPAGAVVMMPKIY